MRRAVRFAIRLPFAVLGALLIAVFPVGAGTIVAIALIPVIWSFEDDSSLKDVAQWVFSERVKWWFEGVPGWFRY